MKPDNKHPFFAEIIESSIHTWTAQSWSWEFAPSFGSLIVLDSNDRLWFGIVFESATTASDGTRQPYAYQKTFEQLHQEQPQIFKFLKTTFQCVAVGFSDHKKIFYQVAPEPIKIHTFVRYATQEESRLFFSSSIYLSVLFQTTIPNIDELVLAILWNQHTIKLLTEEKITDVLEQLSLLTGNDYRRIKLLIQRLEAHNLIH